MTRTLVVGLLMVVGGLVIGGTALADPNGPNVRGVFTYTCDNGRTVDMEAGPQLNQGRVSWDVNTTTVFVVKYVAVTDGVDTFVFLDSTHGRTDLTTCTTPGRPGDTFIIKGWFSPRG